MSFIDKQAYWVVVDKDNEPIGFIMTRDLPESLFIHELSVSQKWQNKGVGKLLIQKIIDVAKEKNYPMISLTTFRYVPWNAPFYQLLGFSILTRDEAPSSLQSILEKEISETGFDPKTRCIMALVLQGKY